MKRKVFNLIVLICLILISVYLAYTAIDLRAENKQLKQDYRLFDKRLSDVEAEWDSVHVVTKKIKILAPRIDRIAKKKLGFFIHYYGKKYYSGEILTNIMISLPSVESTYYKYAIGLAGERGYYQLHPIHNLDMARVYDEDYQVKNAYEILMENVGRHNKLQLAVNGYNGWPSVDNPYYSKVVTRLTKIKNI